MPEGTGIFRKVILNEWV